MSTVKYFVTHLSNNLLCTCIHLLTMHSHFINFERNKATSDFFQTISCRTLLLHIAQRWLTPANAMQVKHNNTTLNIENPNRCPHCHVISMLHGLWSCITPELGSTTALSIWRWSMIPVKRLSSSATG